jgi:putative endonuclease
MPDRVYTVYILASLSRRLYVGVTSDLARRVHEHRAGREQAFTWRYRITRLVYFEQTSDIKAAITREKQLKSWRRDRKIALIESVNAGWEDLASALDRTGTGRRGQICHPERSEGSRPPSRKDALDPSLRSG